MKCFLLSISLLVLGTIFCRSAGLVNGTLSPAPGGGSGTTVNNITVNNSTFVTPTNILAISVKYSGTNTSFYATNNTYGNVQTFSNAIYFATNVALTALANGTDSNVVIQCEPFTWLFDFYNNGGAFGPNITLPSCVELLGSGPSTFFTYTNCNVPGVGNNNDAQWPLPVSINGGRTGNCSMNFYLNAAVNTGAGNTPAIYHDITFLPTAWDANGVTTNGVIDAVHGSFVSNTNRYYGLHVPSGTYDGVNVSVNSLNGRMFLQFDDCDFLEQSHTNSTSLTLRAVAVQGTRSNAIIVLNNCKLKVDGSITNLTAVTAGANTNDFSCVEFLGQGAQVWALHTTFFAVVTNGSGNHVAFTAITKGPTGTNTLFLDGYSAQSFNTNLIDWGLAAGSRSNRVVFIDTPFGWTNYIQDGVWYNYALGPVGIPTNTASFATVAQANLHTVALNKGWTNDLGARSDLVIDGISTNSTTAMPILQFTNTSTGESHTNNSYSVSANATNYWTWTISDIGTNEFGSISNWGAAGTVIIRAANWKLK